MQAVAGVVRGFLVCRTWRRRFPRLAPGNWPARRIAESDEIDRPGRGVTRSRRTRLPAKKTRLPSDTMGDGQVDGGQVTRIGFGGRWPQGPGIRQQGSDPRAEIFLARPRQSGGEVLYFKKYTLLRPVGPSAGRSNSRLRRRWSVSGEKTGESFLAKRTHLAARTFLAKRTHLATRTFLAKRTLLRPVGPTAGRPNLI